MNDIVRDGGDVRDPIVFSVGIVVGAGIALVTILILSIWGVR